MTPMDTTNGETVTPLERSVNRENNPFWQNDVESVVRPKTREMLQTYAGVPPEKVIDHIKLTQNRAWDVSPFASVGQLTWLNPYILLHPAHDEILLKVIAGASILDCACMIAPDLRQLAYEGAPTDKMYGFDIENAFFNVGFEFYNDESRWRGHFFQADALDDFSDSLLGELEGKMDIIWCAKFLHIFDKENQIKMAAKLARLLKPEPGSIFVGSQNGLPEPLDIPIAEGKGFKGQSDRFRMSNAEEMQEMWGEVANLTGIEWKVETRLLDLRAIGMHKEDGSQFKKLTGHTLQWTATIV